MSKKLSTVLLLAGLVLVLGGAAALYHILPDHLEQQNAGLEPAASAEESAAREQAAKVAAPDFTALDAQGERVALSDLTGTPIVLNFWASWCGPCVTEMPDFQEVYDTLDGSEVRFVLVNLTDGGRETVDSANAFLEAHGFTMPVLYDVDQEAALAYGVHGIPTTWFIDRHGYLAGGWEGLLSQEGLLQGIAIILEQD